MKFWTDFRPATGVLAALVLFLAVGAAAQTTNGLSDAEIQGRKLAQQLCDARPAENFTNTGVLQIRDGTGNRSEIQFKCETIIMASNWCNYYEAHLQNGLFEKLSIDHSVNSPGGCFHEESSVSGRDSADSQCALLSVETTASFANSDFWLCDLGLEFFHWPAQKILKKEFRRNCACQVLESTNPSPATNGYSRVVSWIDEDSGGIVQAEAYDARGQLLKEFAPKSFKKVNGQWELQEMEIRNVQTGSRTRLEFDLKK
jgi:hypothetical protein